MDKLNNYIDQYFDEFNSEEPASGHIDRFKEKLDSRNNKPIKTIGQLSMLWKVAATIILFVTVSVLSYKIVVKNEDQTNIALHETFAPEYIEATVFYEIKYTQALDELKMLTCGEGEISTNDILHDIEMLNSNYDILNTELIKNPNDERIINAMIQNYKLRLRLINTVITKVKQNC